MQTYMGLDLEARFEPIYKEFYTNYDLISKSQVLFPWNYHGGSPKNQHIAIATKTSFQIHIGLKKTEGNRSKIGYCQTYNHSSDYFEYWSHQRCKQEFHLLLDAIDAYLIENEIFEHYDFGVLSPVNRGHSFSLIGHIVTNIAICLLILQNRIKAKCEYSEGEKGEIILLALRLESACYSGNALGETAAMLLEKGIGPFYYCGHKERNIYDGKGSQNNFTYEVHSHQKFHSHTLDITGIPLKICMVFSGNSIQHTEIEALRSAHSIESYELQQFIESTLFKDENSEKYYIKQLINKQSAQSTIYDIFSILDAKMVFMIHKIFLNPGQNRIIESFLDHINATRSACNHLEQQNNFAEDFLREFQNSKKRPQENIAILPRYSGKLGGGYMIFGNPDTLEETLSLTRLRLEKYYPQIAYEYCNYRDGYSGETPAISQWIQGKIYSGYTTSSMIKCTTGDGKVSIHNYQEVLTTYENSLVLDLISERIYVHGRKCSSKDFPSQNSTISILKSLVERGGHEIRNKELGNSSYSGSKNEMMSKIITPLKRVIKNEFNLDLGLSCNGSLTEFSLRLDKTNIPIAIIEKLHI